MDTHKYLETKLGKGKVKQNESLARFTTLKVGGKSEYFFVAQTTADLVLAVETAHEAGIPCLVLGGGTNVLISDQGIKGLVIRNQSQTISIVKRLGKIVRGKTTVSRVLVEVDSGVLVNQLVRFTCDEGLSGVERHLGLPGTVGGAIYMNSKWTKPISYIGDALHHAVLVTHEGRLKTVKRDYFNFAYDQSILQKSHEIVVAVTFLFTPEDKNSLWYKAHVSMDYRRNTQPLGVATAGCTFRNISLSDALRIATPNHTTSAGFLVDQVDLKNVTRGKAKFSDKHANFILNLGGAKANDVKGLIDEAQKRVAEKYTVVIEPEIVLLGEFK